MINYFYNSIKEKSLKRRKNDLLDNKNSKLKCQGYHDQGQKSITSNTLGQHIIDLAIEVIKRINIA